MHPSPLAAVSGVGLRAPHVAEVLAQRPRAGWFEVHSENYFLDGGPAIAALDVIRRDYPVALHGVGMSLGSPGPLDRPHLERLRRLVQRVDPALVSEHLCWSHVDGRHLNDLLPLPFTNEALGVVCEHVDAIQIALRRPLLVENISAYLRFADDVMPEWEFVATVAQRTGCKLLLDVNNIYVNASNHGFDPRSYLAAIPGDSIAEIHLGGFERRGATLIDTHGACVAPEVWSLYRATIDAYGTKPTLIEWDTAIPAFTVLQEEAARAEAILSEHRDAVAA